MSMIKFLHSVDMRRCTGHGPCYSSNNLTALTILQLQSLMALESWLFAEAVAHLLLVTSIIFCFLDSIIRSRCVVILNSWEFVVFTSNNKHSISTVTCNFCSPATSFVDHFLLSCELQSLLTPPCLNFIRWRQRHVAYRTSFCNNDVGSIKLKLN